MELTLTRSFAAIALCTLALPVFAQEKHDFSGDRETIPFAQRTYFPGKCSLGAKLTRTDQTPGSNDYTCGNSNDWNFIGGSGAVLLTTTVNGHALSSNVVVSASDLTTGTLPSGQLPAIAESGITSLVSDLAAKASASASTTVNGQACALGSTCTVADSTKVPTSTTVNGHALSGNVVVSASDLTTGTLPTGQLPAIAESGVTSLVSDLAAKASSSASTSVNGQTCTLGSTCTIPIIHSLGASFDGGGSPLVSGKTVYFTVPFACTIQAWNIAVDTGTATVDVWKIATGTAIPTIANTITASALPAISTGTAIHSTTLTGWTTSVAANNIFGINLNAVSGATFVNFQGQCQ